ncbi:MAG: DUF1684 domain-containing protein [Acidimicrobiaceae bacterium]|nr:DUF1684 domain-containing protein [Acidimicrobiaceae bacterium]
MPRPTNATPAGAGRRLDALTLLDWRRRVAALYTEIRATADAVAAHRMWQEVRNDLFAHHPDSPLSPDERANFTGLSVADYDPAYRFVLEVDDEVAPKRIQVETGTDGVVPFERAGRLHVPGVGDLDVWWLATYGGGVFVPIRDGLAGSRTYGGGRYLIDTVKGADLGGDDAYLVVDLNFAYNPSCAYDPTWACPLAPAGNTVAAQIPVGELDPAHQS